MSSTHVARKELAYTTEQMVNSLGSTGDDQDARLLNTK